MLINLKSYFGFFKKNKRDFESSTQAIESNTAFWRALLSVHWERLVSFKSLKNVSNEVHFFTSISLSFSLPIYEKTLIIKKFHSLQKMSHLKFTGI